jgi:hypothetical protein
MFVLPASHERPSVAINELVELKINDIQRYA